MAERKKVVLANPMPHPDGHAMLSEHFDLVELHNASEDELAEAMKDAHAAICNPGGFVPGKAIKAATKLELVTVTGAGYDRIDLETATERGIPVVNNTGVGSIPVAEHAIGMMIGLAKDFRRSDRMVRDQAWGARAHYFTDAMGIELDGLTLGIVGLGNIGSLTAKKCIAAFNMTVLAYDPYLTAEYMATLGVTKVEQLQDMLPQCDFLTVHAPHTQETHHMIGREELRLMKPTAYLINCARGPLVDTAALVEALQGGVIAGAGIDVYEPEPMPADHPFFSLDNALLSPHIAGISTATIRKLAIGAAEQTIQVLQGERPPRLVNPEVWDQFMERRRA